MRALVISTHIAYFPATGAPARDHFLLKHLAERHEIRLIAPVYDSAAAPPGARLPDRVSFTPVPVATGPGHAVDRSSMFQEHVGSRLRRLHHILAEPPYEIMILQPTLAALAESLSHIERSQVDLVQIEHSPIGRLRAVVPPGIPTVLDCHNVHSAILKRSFERTRGRRRVAEWTEWLKTLRFERRTVRDFDALLACSELDRHRLAALAPSVPCSVVPNGVDTAYFSHDTMLAPRENTLLFVGTMNYGPNVEAVLAFCDRVLPLLTQQIPGLRLLIVGRDPTPSVQELQIRHSPCVLVTGGVPDIRPYMTEASIGIVPLCNGGGTRIKILEMLSMGMPVVSTTVGCEGIDVVPGRHLLVADEPDAFASAIQRLLADSDLRLRLGAQGRQLVEERYEWRKAAAVVEKVWDSLVSGGSSIHADR